MASISFRATAATSRALRASLRPCSRFASSSTFSHPTSSQRSFGTDLGPIDRSLRRGLRSSSWVRNPWLIPLHVSTPLASPTRHSYTTVTLPPLAASADLATPVVRPITIPKSLPVWLLGCSALVFGILVIGGLTRLTESGLSITEWQPLTGILPPITLAEWDIEWEKYKVSPEGVL